MVKMKFSVEDGESKRRRTVPPERRSTASSSPSSSPSHASEEEDDNFDGVVDGRVRSSNGSDKSKPLLQIEIDPEVLECSICCEPLSPPVFQCENGHLACSSCCPKLKNKCPSCSCPIGSSRCLALEKVLEAIKIPCCYASTGCKKTLSYAERPAHEETCIYIPCSCPIPDCSFAGCMQQLPVHFKNKHELLASSFKYNLFFGVSVDKMQPFDVLQGQDGVMFFVLKYLDTSVGNIIALACFWPRTKVAFSYELIVRREGSLLMLKAPMENIKQCSRVNLSKDFLVVPHDFFSASGKLRLQIRIGNNSPSPAPA